MSLGENEELPDSEECRELAAGTQLRLVDVKWSGGRSGRDAKYIWMYIVNGPYGGLHVCVDENKARPLLTPDLHPYVDQFDIYANTIRR